MKRLAAGAALLLGSMTTLVLIAPSATAATTTVCDGTISNQSLVAVSVPPYATCVLNNVTVKNDVTAKDPADLEISHSLIKGALDINGTAGYSAEMVVSCTTIGGGLRIRNVSSYDEVSLDGGTDEGTCGANVVRGSVNYAKNQGDVDLELTTVQGNVTASNNQHVSFEGNTIQGNRTCSGNAFVELPDPQDVVHGSDNCVASDV